MSPVTLLAIGTRKGLWLARSEDGRRTWTVEGPHFLAREVAAVAVDTRRDPVRLLAATHSEHWGPTVMRSDDLGATWQETEQGAIRFPEDTGAALARVWQLQPDTGRPARRGVGRLRADLAVAQRRRRRVVRPRPRAVGPPAPAGLARPATAAPRCTPCCPIRPSDRVLVAMSAGGVYASDDGATGWEPRNRGISAYFMPDPDPEYGQCVHKVAARRRRPAAPLRAEPPRRLPLRRRRRPVDVDRRGAAGRLRLPDPRLAARPGHRVGRAAGRRRRARPAGRAAAGAPHGRRRRHLARVALRAARRQLDGGAARRGVRRRRPTRPGSTSAPATAASTPAPTAARPSRSSRPTCPTCWSCARSRSREPPEVELLLPGQPAPSSPAAARVARRRGSRGDARATSSTRWPASTRRWSAGSATRRARCAATSTCTSTAPTSVRARAWPPRSAPGSTVQVLPSIAGGSEDGAGIRAAHRVLPAVPRGRSRADARAGRRAHHAHRAARLAPGDAGRQVRRAHRRAAARARDPAVDHEPARAGAAPGRGRALVVPRAVRRARDRAALLL